MKISIFFTLGCLWIAYGASYASHRFPPTDWWVGPTIMVVIVAGFFALVGLGVLWQWMTTPWNE